MPEIAIKESLNKAFIKVRPERAAIENFKTNFIVMLDTIKANPAETEEFLKNLISGFLQKTWYDPDYFINTSGRIDLVIHTGKDPKSPVGVIIEAKKPGNKTEMISRENLNGKALQELLLYYLRERISNKNLEIKHLIVTNTTEWFIFDARQFEEHFSSDKKLVELFRDFEEGRLAAQKTAAFYTQIAALYIDEKKKFLNYTWFSIQDLEKVIRNSDKEEDNKLISLFKLLSPQHLLKLPFENDSNTLNQNFYAELLYIMGLVDKKDGGKKIIVRNKEGERNEGSLIESAIFRLSDYITNKEELFEVSLELVITWINRILFLKLLESQQVKYQKGNPDYTFLNANRIKNYSDLNNLFFKVLAVRTKDRPDTIMKKYQNIPYLNSSLFDMTQTEKDYFPIANLPDETIAIFSSTVLKDTTGHKRKGLINTLHYIFEFLNAYDFSSEGAEEIQEENKNLINASVLGLIFEKINGYKDGSYFTPGFITTYICRETIRQTVINKFNKAKGWKSETLDDLFNKIEDIREANAIVNSITICDPAVGSGHFLVSALNEIIAIKSDLKILSDNKGRKLKGYSAEVVNDELMVFDENHDFFVYNHKNEESRNVQEAIFQEKQKIIENCLFGVDINPNSVKICRLRLWIELLKNAYYTAESSYTELETLPNIDINIKCGNSLISRFALDIDLKHELAKMKYFVADYLNSVNKYKNAIDKIEKQDLLSLIEKIKNNFTVEIKNNDPLILSHKKLLAELDFVKTEGILFDPTEKERKEKEKKISDLILKIEQKEKEIFDKENGAIYENAFEWRFEFPEVLNNDGNFIGFDAIIGNPPYGLNIDKKYYKQIYTSIDDIYTIFIEKGIMLCNSSGLTSLITPIFWLTGDAYTLTRQYLFDNTSFRKGIILPYDIFYEAYIDTGIFIFAKDISNKDSRIFVYSFNPKENIDIEKLLNIQFNVVPREETGNSIDYKIIFDPISRTLNKKISQFETKIEDITISSRGILADKHLYTDNKINDFSPVFNGKLDRYFLEKNRYSYIKYNNSIKEKPPTYDFFKGERILIRRIISRQFRIMATISNKEFIVKKDIYVFKVKKNKYSSKCLLAIINSKLLSYFLTKGTTSARKDDFTQITLNDIRKIGLPIIDKEKKLQIERLVDNILANNSENNMSSQEKELDRIIYNIFGLSEEEIEAVDGT